jgi:hypothetical protein
MYGHSGSTNYKPCIGGQQTFSECDRPTDKPDKLHLGELNLWEYQLREKCDDRYWSTVHQDITGSAVRTIPMQFIQEMMRSLGIWHTLREKQESHNTLSSTFIYDLQCNISLS